MYRQAVRPYRRCCSQAPPCSWTAPRLFFGLFFVFKSALLLTDAEPSGGGWTATSSLDIGDDRSASLASIASRLHQCFKFNVAHQKREQDQSNHTCSSAGDTFCWPTCVTFGSIHHLLHRSLTSYGYAGSYILHVSGIMSSCWGPLTVFPHSVS